MYGMKNTARILLTAPVGKKTWTFDDDMPYGRVVSDAVIQPNGKILIFNGARRGQTGGQIAKPLMFGAANDVFCYDPKAPAGKRFKVFAFSPYRRYYHSTAALLPNGNSIVMGTDEATNVVGPTAYNHRGELFIPPWLLDGTPRPIIVSVPTGVIAFKSQFVITFTGTVTGVSFVTPGSGSHGTEMSQRLLFPIIVSKTANSITVTAPADATVMLQGFHMLYLLNGDTPSVAAWVKFG